MRGIRKLWISATVAPSMWVRPTTKTDFLDWVPDRFEVNVHLHFRVRRLCGWPTNDQFPKERSKSAVRSPASSRVLASARLDYCTAPNGAW